MLDPDAERWELPVAGFIVTDVWFTGLDHNLFAGQPARRIFIIAYDDDSGWTVADFPAPVPHTKIAFAGPFAYSSATHTAQSLNASHSWESLVPVLALRGTRIVAASADREGFLRLDFDDGSSIAAGPDHADENWELAGPGRLFLVCPLDGGDPRVDH